MMAGMHDVTASDVLADDRQVSGEWLPPATAASRLGVSERTLWRLVKAGRYHRRVVDRKATILVPLPDMGATPGEPSLPDTMLATPSGSVSGVTDTAVLAIVDELRRQAEASLALIAQQAETIGQLRADLAAAESRLLALAAPQSPPEAPGATIAPDLTTDAPAPWWRRWLGAVYG